MSSPQVDVVTGAFSYSGAAIARELRAAGHEVRTLTGHPDRAPAGTPLAVAPLDFTDPAGLARALRGAHTLYNTYWVRFARGTVDHQAAVANSRILFGAAAQAGVRRIVHVSITHPSLDSPYPYFRGKAEVEEILAECGVPYAIARPAILFGGDGVLVNNIAWLLRRLPAFALGGGGTYRIRGIHVDDLAALCVRLDAGTGPEVTDAVGPESLTFRELVTAIRSAVGSRAVLVPVPGVVVPALSGVLGAALRDTLLTADEYHAMADGLADSDGPPTGDTTFTDWVRRHGDELGRRYANEIDRHFTRRPAPARGRPRSLPGPG
jgi:NADH dehydrogenase